MEGYSSDEEGKKVFESDRRFSNYMMFIGSFSMILIFMMANAMQLKKKEDQKKQKVAEATTSTTKYVGKADIGGNWLLYNTKGDPVTHKDFEGKYYLIYFGFTFCPDVCPVSLMKMSKAMNMVEKSKEYKYFDLDAIFVSVDPDRDTNERIEEYCKIFHPRLQGLTHKNNNNPELKEILKKFKIHVSKILLTEEEEKEDMKSLELHAPEVVDKLATLEKKIDERYTLDHSIIVYLMGPDNKFLTYLGSNLDEEDMASLILDSISADLKSRVLK